MSEPRNSEAHVEVLHHFLEALDAAPTADHALHLLADTAARMLEADKVSVVVRTDAGLLQVRAIHWPLRQEEEGIAARVLNSGEPLLVADADTDPRLEAHRRPRYRTPSFLSVAVPSAGKRIAVLNVADRQDHQPFSERDLELARLLARMTGMHLERHQFLERVERLQKESVTDALTGLGNRRHFEQRVISEMGRAGRFGHSLSLIILDIDDFKYYNDSHGHPTGDTALRSVADSLLESVRAIDDVVRYGGEEFAIILPQTPIELATVVAERVRRAITRLDLTGTGEQPRGMFSVSVGVASHPRDARDENELINHADIALYMAKSEGKNRVVVFEPLTEDERRSHRRIPIRLHSVVRGHDEQGRFEEEALVVNISSGGVLLAHRREIPPQTALELSIHSPFTNGGDQPHIFEVNGRLVRRTLERDGFRGAVAFERELASFS
jgi:diguanylate cyclase (GGDEF)-like protein